MQKITLKLVVYIDKYEIKKRIILACIILNQYKTIKKFLKTNKTNIVYMEEIQKVQELFNPCYKLKINKESPNVYK